MLSVDHVAIAFGGVHACDGVTLDFATGSTTAIVGPNGAGKSTLVQLLAGVFAPDRGEIRLDGRRITRASMDVRSSLGIGRTFQTPRIFPGVSIWESTMLGAYAGLDRPSSTGDDAHGRGAARFARRARRTAAEARAKEVLALFGDRLLPRRDDLTYSLSYANRRRVEIARVLAARPHVLLLDEPTAGMNPTETAELTGILTDLHRRDPGLTVIVIEHKMDVVRRLADRVVVMDAGRVIADGDPDEVLALEHVIEAYLGSSETGARDGADVAAASGAA